MPWRRLITSYRAVARPASSRSDSRAGRPATACPSLPACQPSLTLPAYIGTGVKLRLHGFSLGKMMYGYTFEVDN